jgi:FtsZ-interacting cell division protein ZipA
MDSTVVIVLVLLVVVALAVIGYVAARGTRRRDEARAQASELRSDPVASGAGVHDANLEAERAAQEAERLRREAAEAEQRAAQAQQGVTVEQARQEDQLRQADQVDPDVKTRTDDYEPTSPAAGPTAPPETREQPPPRT